MDNGHEFEQTLRDGKGRGSVACCSPWGHKVSDTTERLNNNQLRSRKVNWNKDGRSWVSSESRGSAGSSPLPASGP